MKLGFDEEPNYDTFKAILRNLLPQSGEVEEAILGKRFWEGKNKHEVENINLAKRLKANDETIRELESQI